MSQRLGRRDFAQVVVVTLLWALCYPLITVAVAQAPPLSIGAFRALAAGVLLLVIARWMNRPWPSLQVLGMVSLAGLGLTGVGFAGMLLAGGRVSPGVATVLANVQPLFAAVLGVFILQESLAGKRGLALVLGFGGVVVVSFSAFAEGTKTTASGVAFVLLAAFGVALGNVVLKRIANQADPIVAVGWSLCVGAVPLWILAAARGEAAPHHLSAKLVASALALAVLGTALVSLLWFDLLRRLELVRINTFTFLTPIFGLVIAAVFFNERLGPSEWFGIGLVLASIAICSLSAALPTTAKRSHTVGERTPRVEVRD